MAVNLIGGGLCMDKGVCRNAPFRRGIMYILLDGNWIRDQVMSPRALARRIVSFRRGSHKVESIHTGR
jgi:hypothetical protein